MALGERAEKSWKIAKNTLPFCLFGCKMLSVFAKSSPERRRLYDKRYDRRLPHAAGGQLCHPPDVRQPVPAVLLHGGHGDRGPVSGHGPPGRGGLHRLCQLPDPGLLPGGVRGLCHPRVPELRLQRRAGAQALCGEHRVAGGRLLCPLRRGDGGAVPADSGVDGHPGGHHRRRLQLHCGHLPGHPGDGAV